MASNTFTPDLTDGAADDWEQNMLALGPTVKMVLRPLASLKFTVVLFALAIGIVLIGTLAQAHDDIWEVIDAYFRTSIAWVPIKVLFPPSFFPGLELSESVAQFTFPYPGGWSIGALMGVNLLAAHGVRFKVQVRGTRLAIGSGLILAGMVTTWLVIAGGTSNAGLQIGAWIEWRTLWYLMLATLAVAELAVGYAFFKLDAGRRIECWTLACAAAALGGLLLYLFFQEDAGRLGDSSMRILWQLIKGSFAGLVLLAGCFALFKKRAGIVLLHWGIALLMFNELFVGLSAVEGQMTIEEGQTANYVRDIRSLELAVIDHSDSDEDHVVVVPGSLLVEGATIEHESLPFKVEIDKFYKNAVVRKLKTGEENPATQGIGLQWIAEKARAGTGTDSDSGVDESAAYVKLTDKKSGDDLGTRFVGLFLTMRGFAGTATTTAGKTYDVVLRFKRTYKDYEMTLVDVRKDDYLGTNTPMNYSSEVRVVDEKRNVDREVKIWMNNPLRFAGETFYQSGYNRDPQSGTELTTLAVVTNAGWMIPYVCCMLVGIGMTAQFLVVLLRFLDRRAKAQSPDVSASVKQAEKIKDKARNPSAPKLPAVPLTRMEWVARLFPWIIVAIFAVYLGRIGSPPRAASDEMNLYEFGKLPVVFEGRVKPFDTLARNSLKILSNYQTFEHNSDGKQPAIRWLLDMMAETDDAEKHPVFRIENLEVQETLGLKKREGFRYSLAELRPKSEEFNKQAKKAHDLDAANLDIYQRKILELDRKVRRHTLLQASFINTDFPPFPTEEDLKKDRTQAMERVRVIKRMLDRARSMGDMLKPMSPPLAVPNLVEDKKEEDKAWQPYTTAWPETYVQSQLEAGSPNPAAIALKDIFAAYKAGDAKAFNQEVADYRKLLAEQTPENLNTKKTNFEAYFNHAEPFFYSAVLYLVAFVLTALAGLGWNRPFNRAAFWLIAMTFVVHSVALVGRIYISGRPPVTNLYSSAVFIGWGCVVLGMILEGVFRIGIGNVIAAVSGFIALGIAHILAGDGDTFVVLQAVLDTQFWLATHVVCITLGYATTFVAGILGILYVLRGVFTPSLSPQVGKDLSRMIYGSVCFAMLFSFVGTVLGGLWADDSWGRFWGWDPKENGALIIVLWNALVLHARWGAMAKDRGMAVLAVGGNIVTAWSWFGVNELGVGLHTYGFTDGVLQTLLFFAISQVVIILAGMLPKHLWMSFRKGSIENERSTAV